MLKRVQALRNTGRFKDCKSGNLEFDRETVGAQCYREQYQDGMPPLAVPHKSISSYLDRSGLRGSAQYGPGGFEVCLQPSDSRAVILSRQQLCRTRRCNRPLEGQPKLPTQIVSRIKRRLSAAVRRMRWLRQWGQGVAACS